MDRVVILHNSGQVAEAIEKRGQAAVAGIDRAVGRGAHEVARDAQQHMPKFRSTTAAATNVEHNAPMHYTVRFGTRYAKYTDGGTGPGGRPSLAEMLDWVRLKNIQPRTPGMSQKSLAALIRRSIAQRGVTAQPFAEPALERQRPRLVELMRGALSEALAGDRA
jgi:hypothetical protein